MKKRAIALALVLAMAGTSLAACGGGKGSDEDAKPTKSVEEADKDIDYEYGAGKTFHSDEPVTYSMMFSDHENYPYKDDWRIWSAIEEKTNVKRQAAGAGYGSINMKIPIS